ncbi:MAG TPA: M1 family metallopeptidase [Candidatus Marinimicrobia bacterium]|jgi:aminopeptidase N|nr:M1 family metallopeptidase [Candidatus Neomarinimicrobiota bacterium]MDP6260935.1 M1 family metallopeptidase [Candidatus Neomarinimicrobiota bacterium]MDP7128280.1 M1 family metallopeptidase [Candidatus Neomarinimicrobiota bacterium]MDP7336861.1 M1 family metallopeptidase [Candidatus Neomarinimicrobiota bacterium]MDP7475734.1 M1 family metallopeptidase [Candidatus Neomarinimicrobiota bacterium]|tara:strand:+ start:3233 stop:4921 length:1689 start_codon:yes stop_codon:yes gene_type:complete
MKIISLLPVIVLIVGCLPVHLPQSMSEPPENAASFPKLKERNRLLGALSPERTCYDVQRYDINIDIDVDKKYVKGYVDFTAVAVDDFTVLQVDLAKDMQLNGVYYLGNKLETTRKKDAVFVEFPKINRETMFSFRVHYEGKPRESSNPPWDGGFVWEKDRKGRPFVSVVCEGDGAGLWWPLKDHIMDEPDKGAKMTFTVPSGLFCVSNGQLTSTAEDLENGKKAYIWEVNNPINNYNISVQLGHYVLVQDTLHRNGKIESLNHYVLDYHQEVAKNHFQQAKNVIRFFEKYFGDYQWWADGYKLVEVSYLGMEHQSAVTYGNAWNNWGGPRHWTKAYYGIVDGLLFHETAHEWWGNSVTAGDPAHMWIHEGMAVYSESMFIEDQLGYNVMIDFMLRKRTNIQNKLPIVGPENENYWAFGDSYNKGAWVMHTLRHVIDNDSLWWDILRSFAVDNARKHVKTGDFQTHVESRTDQDLEYFFDQYFFDHRPPKLEYYQKGNKLFYRWADVIPDFRMPLDVDINGIEKRIYPTSSVQTLEIPEFAVVIFKEWQFLINVKENSKFTAN